jgi:hypothetical protein
MEEIFVFVVATLSSRVENGISPAFEPPIIMVEDLSPEESLLLEPLAVPS